MSKKKRIKKGHHTQSAARYRAQGLDAMSTWLDTLDGPGVATALVNLYLIATEFRTLERMCLTRLEAKLERAEPPRALAHTPR